MKKYEIYDDLLHPDHISCTLLKRAAYNCLTNTKIYTEKGFGDIRRRVVEAFDLTQQCNYIEEWAQNPGVIDLPEEHYDKDEELYEATGEYKFPLASCIIYIDVRDLIGSNLVIDNQDVITPKSARIVKLKPGVLHKVTPYISGTRVSLNWNFWSEPLFIP